MPQLTNQGLSLDVLTQKMKKNEKKEFFFFSLNEI
jgi:hypothetical protein